MPANSWSPLTKAISPTSPAISPSSSRLCAAPPNLPPTGLSSSRREASTAARSVCARASPAIPSAWGEQEVRLRPSHRRLAGTALRRRTLASRIASLRGFRAHFARGPNDAQRPQAIDLSAAAPLLGGMRGPTFNRSPRPRRACFSSFRSMLAAMLTIAPASITASRCKAKLCLSVETRAWSKERPSQRSPRPNAPTPGASFVKAAMRSQCQLSVNEIGVALVLRAAALRPDWERDLLDGSSRICFDGSIPRRGD